MSLHNNNYNYGRNPMQRSTYIHEVFGLQIHAQLSIIILGLVSRYIESPHYFIRIIYPRIFHSCSGDFNRPGQALHTIGLRG